MLQEELHGLWKFFSSLACPKLIPCKNQRSGKAAAAACPSLKGMENKRHTALTWRRSEDQTLKAKDPGNSASHSALLHSPFILHVYLTST